MSQDPAVTIKRLERKLERARRRARNLELLLSERASRAREYFAWKAVTQMEASKWSMNKELLDVRAERDALRAELAQVSPVMRWLMGAKKR